ncbi:WXG100 family type VII secretion target [Sphaerisporangium sp. NPDC051017]|uniref:WXG100 family type VII secretion target n=1 Tax=Sphaerisporangium sp. NPDC051017 TaxID=3154636 RepID=UPI0034473F9D
MERISDIQPVKAGTTSPRGDSGTYGGVESVRKKLENTDPDGISTAGGAYIRAAEVLGDTVSLIESVAGSMAGDWKDQSSKQAQEALRLLHASARELSERARQVGAAHNIYADELRKAKANLPDSGHFHFDDDIPENVKSISPVTMISGWLAGETETDNEKARKHLEELNKQITTVYNGLPVEVTTVLPAPGPPVTPPIDTVNYPKGDPYSGSPSSGTGYDGSGSSYGGNYPGGGKNGSISYPGGSGIPGSSDPGTGPGGTGPGGTGQPPGGGSGLPPGTGTGTGGTDIPGGGLPPGSGTNTGQPPGLDPGDPRGTGLAGVQPPGTNTMPPGTTQLNTPPGLGNPTGLPNGLTTPPGMNVPTSGYTGPLGTGPFGAGPLGTGPGASLGGGTSYGGAGGLGAAGQALAGRAPAAGPMGGMPFMPMGGGGADGTQERERSTWLTEDESVWGGDGPVAPGVIA